MWFPRGQGPPPCPPAQASELSVQSLSTTQPCLLGTTDPSRVKGPGTRPPSQSSVPLPPRHMFRCKKERGVSWKVPWKRVLSIEGSQCWKVVERCPRSAADRYAVSGSERETRPGPRAARLTQATACFPDAAGRGPSPPEIRGPPRLQFRGLVKTHRTQMFPALIENRADPSVQPAASLPAPAPGCPPRAPPSPSLAVAASSPTPCPPPQPPPRWCGQKRVFVACELFIHNPECSPGVSVYSNLIGGKITRGPLSNAVISEVRVYSNGMGTMCHWGILKNFFSPKKIYEAGLPS